MLLGIAEMEDESSLKVTVLTGIIQNCRISCSGLAVCFEIFNNENSLRGVENLWITLAGTSVNFYDPLEVTLGLGEGYFP